MATPLSISGAVPVLVTPFDADGGMDLDSLRRQIDFCLASGAQALAFGMGSETGMLTDAEREQVWRAAAEHAAGRVPVIAAPSHPSREGIIALTRLASASGVDCVMVNPEGRKGESVVSLFRDLSERVDIPILVQDAQGNAPVDTLLEAVRESDHVISFKIECAGAADKIGRLVERLGKVVDRSITILGGYDGAALPEELERGSVGTMPHPAIVDAFRQVCDLHAGGDAREAEAVYYRKIVPLIRLSSAGGGLGGGIWMHKMILHRAGILSSPRCRIETDPQPDWVMEKIWNHLKRAKVRIAAHLG